LNRPVFELALEPGIHVVTPLCAWHKKAEAITGVLPRNGKGSTMGLALISLRVILERMTLGEMA
jgi:hypothetical protein